MVKTPRNGLEANVAPGDQDMLAQIDTVYEICDAEFTSDSAVHSKMRAIYERQAPSPVEKGIAILKPLVIQVAKREGFMKGVDDATVTAVTRQLSTDWNKTLGADIRREQSASPAP